VARKKTGLSQTLFQGIDPYGEGQAQEGDLQTLPLAAIRPDPDQPRRLLPADLARAVADGELTPLAAMRAWVEQAKKGAEDAGLAALRRLADSISRHGLINPISVRRLQEGEEAPEGVAYFIVTGERRYWAHVLLALEGRNLHAGETVREPTEIRAGLTAPGITVRAHQLIENIMREDINAVEKARGLWALRYELSQVNDSSPVKYGSKVNDSSPDTPPPDLVPWKRVSEELGISKRYRIYLTSVLKLSEEAQALVMEHDLAEVTIRPIVQKLRDDSALQVAALQQLVTWQEENEAEDGPNRAITRSVNALVDELLQRKEKASDRDVQDAARAVDHAAQTRLFRRRVRHVLRFLYDLPDEDLTLLARDLALDAQFSGVGDELSDLQRQIDALLQRVETYRRDVE
jgi:ParB-like chromosome segregation protein Spo0J